MESFFHTINVKLIYGNVFETRSQARCCIFEYNEVFYNRIRILSIIGYNRTGEYEKREKLHNLASVLPGEDQWSRIELKGLSYPTLKSQWRQSLLSLLDAQPDYVIKQARG